MLTEEAHHMFVGQTGMARIIKRTAERMKEGDPETTWRDSLRHGPATHQFVVRTFLGPFRGRRFE